LSHNGYVSGHGTHLLVDLRAARHAPQRVILGGGGIRNSTWRTLLAETLDLAWPTHS